MNKHIVYSATVIFMSVLGIGFIIPFLPDFSRKIGGEALVGIIYSGFAMARIFAVPTASMLSDRIGRKKILILGLIIYSITSSLYPHTYNFWTLFGVRIVHGIASSMVLPISFAYALDYAKAGKEGFISAILGGSLLLGFGLGPIIGAALSEFFGESFAFYLMGLMGAIALSEVILFMREPPSKKSSAVSASEEVKSIFSSYIFLVSFFIWFLVMVQRGVVIAYSPLILEEMEFRKISTGAILTSYAIISSAFQYASAKFVDRLKNSFLICSLLGILSSIALGISTFLKSPIAFSSLLVLSGVLSSLIYPIIMAELSREAIRKNRVGGTIGFMDWAFSFGNLLGPTIFGILSKGFGVGKLPLILGIFETIAFSVIFFTIEKVENKDKSSNTAQRKY